MKKFSMAAFFSLLSVCMLVFVTIKTIELEQKMTQLVRPAKLFTPSAIISDFPHNPQWDVKITPSHDRFFHIVSQQPLYWLGKGMQAVAFETEDKKFVVKFFLLSRLRSSEEKKWFSSLFSSGKREKETHKLQQRNELFASAKMCFEELPEETGFIYVHLNKTADKIKGVKLIDKYGQSHRIRGDDVCFVVQKKASYIISTLSKLMDAGNFDKACQRLDQIFDLLLRVAKKGFVDGDDALIRNNNIGFSHDSAIYIDTGHLVRADKIDLLARMQHEFDVRLEPLEKWLDVMYPELGQYFAKRRLEIIEGLQKDNVVKKAA